MRNVSLAERVCESFFAKNINLATKLLKQIINIGELRFDLSELTLQDIETIFEKSAKPLLFTCRTHSISTELAIEAYSKAINCGYEYIDIDYFENKIIFHQLKPLIELKKTKLLLSFHNYENTPDLAKLREILKELNSYKNAIPKISCMTYSSADVNLLSDIQREYPHAIIIGMGTYAVKSRIKSLRLGAPFTYLALDSKQTTAAGQIDFKIFQEQYQCFRGVEKLKLAVLGNPISHSKSPDLFRSFFLQDKLNGIYEKIELKDIKEFSEIQNHYDGFNVTAPFKQSIISYIDDLSEAAIRIGAVNTVFRKNGKWLGDNTDYIGILEAIKSKSELSEINNCLVIGAGGAARAAAFAMNQAQIKFNITNRTYSKAKILSQEFSSEPIENPKLKDFHLIINTIPEPFSVINAEELNRHHIILDAIYPRSFFISKSLKVGFTLISGEVWLKKQALKAYQIFKTTI